MPWTPHDARRHDKKAVGKKATKWSKVANSVLAKTGDEAKAIRIASGVVKKGKGK